MAVRINKGSAMQQLPVVPLVDTLLNLLIFFLVAAKFAELDRELDAPLPDAESSRPETAAPGVMFVDIDADGRYYVGKQVVSRQQLHRALQAAWVNNPGRVKVRIAADRNCRWQAVVAAIDACKKAKIRDYSFSTGEGRAG